MKKKFLTVLLVLSMVVLASCSNQKGSELESKLKEVETDKKFALENLNDANNKIKELKCKNSRTRTRLQLKSISK